MNIEDYLSATSYKTREQLIKETNMSDREIRRQISELKKRRVVIYSSSTRGYRLAKEIKSMSKREYEEEINVVKHSLNENKSRIKKLKAQNRKYIAYIKKAEQLRMEQENENHIPSIY